MGIFPASRVLMTSSACLVHVAVISFKYLACVSPSFFCSGMATAILPPSSTSCPNASSRASSPATRTAEGPISTPRRDWPRSSGTPITRIFLGVMLVALIVVVIGFGMSHQRLIHGLKFFMDRAYSASAEKELSPARVLARRSKRPLARCPYRSPHEARYRTYAGRDTTGTPRPATHVHECAATAIRAMPCA